MRSLTAALLILITTAAAAEGQQSLTVTRAEYQSLCLGMTMGDVFDTIYGHSNWSSPGDDAVSVTVGGNGVEYVWRGDRGSDMVFATMRASERSGTPSLTKATHTSLPAITECAEPEPHGCFDFWTGSLPEHCSDPPQPESSAVAKQSFGNGSYEVGVDIVPGLYHSEGPDMSGFSCFFYRLRIAGGSTSYDSDDIIDMQRLDGPALANILPSDGGFVSEGCQPWTRRR